MRFAAATLGEEPIGQLQEIVTLCERMGYDDFFHGDEKYTRDVYVSLGYCAALTRRIGLGISVTDPYTRHPALTAQAIATLDEASNGRLIVTMGAGSHFDTLGIERRRPVDAIREAVFLIRELLAGKIIEYHGNVIHFNKGQLGFKPARIPPIFIAARGKGTLQLAGEIGDGVVVGSFATEKGLRYSLDLIKKGAENASRELGQITKLLWVYGCIDRDSRKAHEAVIRGISHALWSSRELWVSGILEEEVGVKLPDPLRKFMKEAPHDWRPETMSNLRRLIPESLAEDLSLSGTAEDVIEKLEMIAKAGLDGVIIWAHPTEGKGVEHVFRSYAEAVLPRFRH